jgi:AcrR family transcriptional regulator
MVTTQAPTAGRAQGHAEARRRRRAELLEAADRLISRRGASASMDEIAAEAGISKPILYRHFGDKDGLYRALAEWYVEELMGVLRDARMVGSTRTRIAAGIDAYLSFIERDPERYRFLLGAAEQPRTSTLVAEFRRRLADECAFVTAERLRGAGVDPELAEPWAHGVVGMVRSVGIWWLESRSLPRARLVDHLTDLLWEGLSGLRARARASRKPVDAPGRKVLRTVTPLGKPDEGADEGAGGSGA